jgi:hypothetical protein
MAETPSITGPLASRNPRRTKNKESLTSGSYLAKQQKNLSCIIFSDKTAELPE